MIGIGGCGMSGLAEVLSHYGARVSGTDRIASAVTTRLARSGTTVEIAEQPGPLPDGVELVVVSSAVPASHRQLVEARAIGGEVLKYAQLLGRLMAERVGVAVAGTHGKSTTTAWTTYLLRQAGLDPTFVIGANVPQLGGGAAVGGGEHFVAEACEYDRSFLGLNFHFGVILNVEEDHLDYYDRTDEIDEAFADFARRTDKTGVMLLNRDDPRTWQLADRVEATVKTIGIDHPSTWRAVDLVNERGCFSFAIAHDGTRIATTTLRLPGRHHVYNALAAAALAHHCGVAPKRIGTALRTFDGASRRLTLMGDAGGVTILDDYAHHPTEVAATLTAAREHYAPRKLRVVFQPHQHSRTRAFLDEFADSLTNVDEVIVPDIYFVRDDVAERDLVGADDLVTRISKKGGRARHVRAFQDIVNQLAEATRDGDVVITMGAGDIWKVADELANRLRADH